MTRTVYRGALVCGRIGCSEVLDRYGHCPDGHYAIPEWSEDAEEIKVEVGGIYERPEHSVGFFGGWLLESVEFEGKPFPLAKGERERLEQEWADEMADAAIGRREDHDADAFDGMGDR